MSLSTRDVSLAGLDGLSGVDSLCLFVGEDERPLRGAAGFADWRLCGGLSKILRRGLFAGASGDKLLLPAQGRLPVGRIFALGIGTTRGLTGAKLAGVLSEAAETLRRAGATSAALEIPGAGTIPEEDRTAAFRSAFLAHFPKDRVTLLAERSLARGLEAPPS